MLLLPAFSCATPPNNTPIPPAPTNPQLEQLATDVAQLQADNATLAAQIPDAESTLVVSPATIAPPATLSLTPQPVSTTVPITITGTPTLPLMIQSFTVSAEAVGDSKRLQFVWASSGGIAGFIENGASSTSNLTTKWTVPPAGTLTVELPDTQHRNPTFTLFVYNHPDLEIAQTVSQTVQLAWECRHHYFFNPIPPRCPLQPANEGWALEQQFEHGKMIWVHEVAGNGVTVRKTIYVLYEEAQNENQWQLFDDYWTQAQPIRQPNIVPPTGFLQPERSFGKVWRENQQVRDRLGWATGYERGFYGGWQTAPSDEPPAITTYLSTYDGQVMQLIGEGNAGNFWTPTVAFSPTTPP